MSAQRAKGRGRRFFAATLVCLAFACAFPNAAWAIADLSILQSNISFSSSTFYVGETVRIYARVRNLGDVDMTATVYFYQGPELIARAQPISLPASGAPEEVFVDYVVPSGTFNVRAVIMGADPEDENPDNDEAVTPLYAPVADEDRDGVVDGDDNCDEDANGDQTDTDDDSRGDACDTDDDDDGLTDAEEADEGTNPLDADSDDDGVPDEEDIAPLVVDVEEPSAVEAITSTVTTSNEEQTSQAAEEASATSFVDETDDEDVDDISFPSRAYGVLHLSPRARFSYVQNDWNTYVFTVEEPSDAFSYAWDFGDGASSALTEVTHTYDGPGGFLVTLTSRDGEGREDTDRETVTVSFFSLANPWLQALLGFFAVLLGALLVLIVSMRRKEHDAPDV